MEEEYRILGATEHVLKRPGLYIGSVSSHPFTGWLYDGERMVHHDGDIKENEGLLKILEEAIMNAFDNTYRGENPTKVVRVSMDATKFTIYNDGQHIPVRQADLGDGVVRYIATSIFGEHRSGSNFKDKDRQGAGQNGLGVKLLNIFSSEFSVECVDPDEGKCFRQTWTGHMGACSAPRVTPRTKAKGGSTTVSCVPDLSLFDTSFTSLVDVMGPFVLTRLLSMVATHPNGQNMRVYYNDKRIKCSGFKGYVRMFSDKFMYDSPSPDFEYAVAVNKTGKFEHQSFANCNYTPDTGSSQTVYVTKHVVKVIAGHLRQKLGKDARLSSSYVENHLQIFVNIRIPNATFTTQTKIKLSNPIDPAKYPLNDTRILSVISKTGLLRELEDTLERKVISKMQRSLNGAKTRNLHVPKLDDAHHAGTAKSSDTMLFLTEGDSAKTFVTMGLSVIGRARYGVFPLRGKLLNVIGASPSKLKGNAEIANVMKIMGLQFDRKYESESDRRTLRYSRLCVLTDADTDGHHICGLLLAFVSHFWPALAHRSDFMYRFVTPAVKVVKGGSTVATFFSPEELESFQVRTGMQVMHLKGLGTSTKNDALAYFRAMDNVHLKRISSDEGSRDLLRMVFSPKESNWRKQWLTKKHVTPRGALDYGRSKAINMSEFLEVEMYAYSIANIKRAMASAIDGLKVSQRKILFASLDKFRSENSPEVKVAQLASLCAAKSNYGHGEVSLQGAIVAMSQSFPGSNNVPLFTGSFGTRMQNGADAASPRYIFTRLAPGIVDLIGDTSVLEYLVEETMPVEPKYYVPALPMILVNGSNGIATGFRTLVPAFNPADIVEHIRAHFEARTPEKALVPWYRGYTTNHLTVDEGSNYVFTGAFEERDGGTTLVITELPIGGHSMESYKDDVLAKLVESNVVKRFEIDHLSENEPRFKVFLNSKCGDVIETFKLRAKMTKTCMNLLDQDDVVVQFKSPEDILAFWLEHRKAHVAKSKANTLRTMREARAKLEHKRVFIQAVIEGTRIDLRNADEERVRETMRETLGIPDEHHEKLLGLPLSSITKARARALEMEAHKLDDAIETVEGTSETSMLLRAIEPFGENHGVNGVNGANKRRICK